MMYGRIDHRFGGRGTTDDVRTILGVGGELVYTEHTLNRLGIILVVRGELVYPTRSTP